MLDVDRLRTLLSYDPTNGEFVWCVSRGRKAPAGSVAGSIDSRGYRQIKIDGRSYLAHRLAWLFTNGSWPSDDLDHIDRDPLNNRIENLRVATHAQNHRNQGTRRDNRVGLKGVGRRNGKFRARITVNGKQVYLGNFDTAAAAHAAYAAASSRLHGCYGRTA